MAAVPAEIMRLASSGTLEEVLDALDDLEDDIRDERYEYLVLARQITTVQRRGQTPGTDLVWAFNQSRFALEALLNAKRMITGRLRHLTASGREGGRRRMRRGGAATRYVTDSSSADIFSRTPNPDAVARGVARSTILREIGRTRRYLLRANNTPADIAGLNQRLAALLEALRSIGGRRRR